MSYEPGYVVEFHRIVKGAAVGGRKEKCFRSGEQWTVVRRDPGGSVLVEREGVQKFLPLEHSGKFDLYRPEQIALAAGDTVRITKNFGVAGTRFRNNEFRRVAAVDAQTITFDGGNRIEAESRFLHIDQGVAVSSYARQSRTIDQVIASAPVKSFRRSIVRSFMSRCPELARPCIFSLIASRRYERRRAGRVNGFRRSRSGARTK